MVYVLGMYGHVGVASLVSLVCRRAKVQLPAVRHRARQKVHTSRIAHQRDLKHIGRTFCGLITGMVPDRVRGVRWAEVPVVVAVCDPHVFGKVIPPVAIHFRLRAGMGGLVGAGEPHQIAAEVGHGVADHAYAC